MRYRMLRAMAILLAIGATSGLSAQESPRWVVRLGGTASGTLDDGVIAFDPGVANGAGAFHFSNSWGAAITAERVWRRHWHAGVHVGYAATSLRITVPKLAGPSHESEDHTSFAPALLGITYGFLPDRRVNPFVGVTGGVLFARDARLNAAPSEPRVAFAFDDGATYGYVFGADVSLGGWLAHLSVRSLAFEFALNANALVPEQTLLDQTFATAWNHIVLGVGKRW